MRIHQVGLVGLLAVHAGAVSAATADAPLSVSVTVLSTCAVSAGIGARSPMTAGPRGMARVNCSPAAAYTVSFDPKALNTLRGTSGEGERTPPLPFNILPARRDARDDVVVVEIAY